MANSADPDQLASSLEANWSGSTLFEKTGYIPVQQWLYTQESFSEKAWHYESILYGSH